VFAAGVFDLFLKQARQTTRKEQAQQKVLAFIDDHLQLTMAGRCSPLLALWRMQLIIL
jgi:hypothetical protein